MHSEPLALDQLRKEEAEKGRGLRTCSLYVDTNTGYVTASPDGIIDNEVKGSQSA